MQLISDTSPRHIRNRRAFDVQTRMCDTAGVGFIGFRPGEAAPEGLSDAEYAVVIADAGQLSVQLFVETAARKSRAANKIWKASGVEEGMSAALFAAHGQLEHLSRLAAGPSPHLDFDALQRARALLRRYFPWSEDDDAEVDFAIGLGGLDQSAHQKTRYAVAFGAVSRITGRADAAALPRLRPLELVSDPEMWFRPDAENFDPAAHGMRDYAEWLFKLGLQNLDSDNLVSEQMWQLCFNETLGYMISAAGHSRP